VIYGGIARRKLVTEESNRRRKEELARECNALEDKV